MVICLQAQQLSVISPSNSGSTDGINTRVVEGQTHDSLKLSPDAHSAAVDKAHEESALNSNVDLAPGSCSSLKIGSTFRFRLTVLQASHVPSDYADIFCQFK